MSENDQVAPVREGEEHKVYINAVGAKGDGIAKVKGFVLFVSDVKKGDYVKVKVTKVLKNSGFAMLVEKLEKPVRKSKFATVSAEEFNAPQEDDSDSSQYEETDDFGADLDEDD